MDTTSKFGALLHAYCTREGIKTYKQFEKRLTLSNFDIDSSSINRYMTNKRKPSAEFIYAATHALKLNQAEVESLVHAHAGDIAVGLLNSLAEQFNKEQA